MQTMHKQTNSSDSHLSDSKLVIIHPSQLDLIWDNIKSMAFSIADSTKGRMSLGDIYQFIMNQDILLWASVLDKKIEAICLTEILNYKGRKMLVILGGSGEHKEHWDHFVANLIAFAKKIGCDGVETRCRKGWVKLFRAHGFEDSHAFCELIFAKES